MFPDLTYLFIEDDNKKSPNRLKCQYTLALRDSVWRKPGFIVLAPQVAPLDKNRFPTDVASNSGRKCSAEYVCNCGTQVNEVEIRGWWKGQKGGRVLFCYINVQQLLEDAKVAGLLCRGGPVWYATKKGVDITDDWLFEHVVPNIRRRFPNDPRMCRVFGHSILYICLQTNDDIFVPPYVRERVETGYAALGIDEEEPVEKVLLNVY